MIFPSHMEIRANPPKSFYSKEIDGPDPHKVDRGYFTGQGQEAISLLSVPSLSRCNKEKAKRTFTMLGEGSLRLKVDLHVHSAYSYPTYGNIDEVLARAEERGLDGIAITDLGTINGALEASEKAGKIIVIPGCEVQTEFGHLLALGLKEPLPVRLKYEETIKRARSCGGIVVLAHPYAGWPKRAIWEKCKPDAVETVNALYPFFDLQTYMSRVLARGFNLPEIGGSDAHFYSNVGDAYTVLYAEDVSVDAIIEAIRRGLTCAQGKPQPLRTRFVLGVSAIFSYIF